MNQVTLEALRVLGVGMGTVFSVLVIFYLIVKGLQIIFPPESQDEA
ncbi:MAG: OadG family protein [Caldicoprobacterales bacterium]|jgi:Na+-transporting methylmalonyl-CoA/oxaloacetate decarboxylase gamma subunit|nr:OadG family protein [Clostridiales bacterium]